MNERIEKDLSNEQKAPLQRESINANILAGAGSGKTRTMVRMILNDIQEGISPSNIVAFTFTEKAADELLARIHKLGNEYLKDVDMSGIYIGTIHKWCLEFLQEKSNFYNFEPFDELQTQALVGRIHDKLGLDDIYSSSYPHSVDEFLDDLNVFYSENLSIDEVPTKIRPAIKNFLEILQENRLLTFGDMIRHTISELEDQPLEEITSLYVDEYQDVNPAQVELVKKMLPEGNSRVVVGDDMQCIYQWRGSDPQKILDFENNFPDVQTFSLETNYRSLPNIVEFANQISSQLPSKYSQREMNPWRQHLCNISETILISDLNQGSIPAILKTKLEEKGHTISNDASLTVRETDKLWTIDDNDNKYFIENHNGDINVRYEDKLDLNKVQWITVEDEKTQAKRIADIIEKLHENGVEYNQIAILMRSVINSGQPIVKKLGNEEIPVNCPVLSKKGQLITNLIIPIFDWLRKENKEPRDRIERKEQIEKINNIEEAVQKWIGKQDVLDRFWDGISKWEEKIENQENIAYNVRTCLYDLLEYCGLEIDIENQALIKGLGIASQIIRSVEKAHRRRLSGEMRMSPRKIMNETYYELKRNKDNYGELLTLDEKSKGVVVSTVHQAKGLEWPVVIIPNLQRGKFPVKERKHNTSFPDHIAERYGTKKEDELRLFYVAVTRARDRLFLIDPNKLEAKKRSNFLKELNKEGVIEPSIFSNLSNDIFKLKEENLSYKDTSPVLIGLSDLLIYLESPYQYLLRRRANIQPSIGEELGYGDSMHELIQLRYESDLDSWSNDEIIRKVKKRAHIPYVSKKREEQFKKSLIERMEKLEQMNVFEGDVEVEKSVDLVFESGIVQGVIDFIEYLDENKVLIRDWKTSVHEKFIPRYEKQMLFYALALNRKGYEVKKAEIVDISKSFEKEKLKGYDINVNEEKLNDIKNKIGSALKEISKEKFTKNCSSEDKKNWRNYLKQEAGREYNIFKE